MKEKFSVVIIGDGRIGQAAAYYFRRSVAGIRVLISGRTKDIKNADLLVGAMPGELGEGCLDMALRYKKNLLDISDIDPPFYLRHKKEITRQGITVIPGCGFSPGLVNFLLGRETASKKRFESIEIKAGSLSRVPFYFPFLWCFEDLMLEHQIPSWQWIAGKKRKFPAFAAMKKERFFGIPSETCYCASGFENVFEKAGVRNFTTRVIRPEGYRAFFGFLRNQGFLRKENFTHTKEVLESSREDNRTLARMIFYSRKEKIVWQLMSFSKRNETLNSMQKITASVPAVIGQFLLANRIPMGGLIFMEDLAHNADLVDKIVAGIRRCGISVKRSVFLR
ncbi:MAG: hypothetical protein KKC84_01960 [Candidatus Omnitrophica bacterium]|nr:hypothetical protein [Candidatus Omnitrophota bacterium]